MTRLPTTTVRAPRPTVVKSSKCVITSCSSAKQPQPHHKEKSSSSSLDSTATTATQSIFRRELLLTIATSALATLASGPSEAAENAAVTASLGRYVKRKKLDRIDSYVAPLLTAREQLIRIGRVMVASPKDARQLLRSGSFSGLRASVRAIGDYTAERGAGKDVGNALVSAFFTALEKLDFELLSAERAAEGVVVDKEVIREKLNATIAALDKLLESVPQDAMDKARNVVKSLANDSILEEEGIESNVGEGGSGSGGAAAVDEAELKRLVKADSEEDIDDSHITVLTTKNFNEIVKPEKYALVEFYAPWCGHCKAFRSGFADAATILKTLDPSILVAKIDADTEKDIGEQFGIEGFPTFKFLENGQAVSEFNDELSTEKLVEWVKKVLQGGSTEITSMKQAEEILSSSPEQEERGDEKESDGAAPVVVVGYFKNGFEAKEYKAFKKLAMVESNGNEAVFYRTSDPKIAAKLGVTLPTSGTTPPSFSLAITRKYPNHPVTTIQYAGHKAERLPPASADALFPGQADTDMADLEEAQVLRKFKAFFYAEKLPDFIQYSDAIQDGGNLVMSVPYDFHMYVVAPPEKLNMESTTTTLRDIASQLRGQIIVLAADPAAEEPGMKPTMYPIASTFQISHTSTDFFVGVVSATNGTRYTCNIPPASEKLDVAVLVKCGEEILAGGGTRIYSSKPAPENPKQGNFTVLVGTTMDAVVKDPTKDVLLEVYAPWCGACRSFAPEYAKLAAAVAEVPSVVVAKMDGSENDHRDIEIQEFPTLLFYPAEKDAKPIRVDITEVKELAEFVHKNAKIPFELPDLTPFQDMEVDLSEFGDVHVDGGDEEESEFDHHDHGDEVEEEGDGSSETWHDEL